MTLLIIISTYVVVSIVARYTALGEYQWFNDLELYLLDKYPKAAPLIREFFSFKLFHCTPCQSFWLSVPIMSYFYAEPINIILSLLIYILKTTNSNGNA